MGMMVTRSLDRRRYLVRPVQLTGYIPVDFEMKLHWTTLGCLFGSKQQSALVVYLF